MPTNGIDVAKPEQISIECTLLNLLVKLITCNNKQRQEQIKIKINVKEM